MTISIQPSALADLREGFRFCEAKERGQGSYFIDTLFSDIDSLQLDAGIHSVHFGRFHRLLSKRCPGISQTIVLLGPFAFLLTPLLQTIKAYSTHSQIRTLLVFQKLKGS